jgi:hypothetical protein
MKISTKTILALYATALRILDSKIYFWSLSYVSCTMGHLFFILNGRETRVNYSSMYPEYCDGETNTLGLPQEIFTDIYTNTSLSRQEAAKKLRDFADKAILAIKTRSKINREALLRVARYIENNPDSYVQEDYHNCIIGIAYKLAPYGQSYNFEIFAENYLGLNSKQFHTLYHFGLKERSGYKKFMALPKEKQVQLGVARIRTMVLRGQ